MQNNKFNNEKKRGIYKLRIAGMRGKKNLTRLRKQEAAFQALDTDCALCPHLSKALHCEAA